MNRIFIPTTEKVEVKDYPYGFRLKTTLYDSIETDLKKGYRHVTQTINPKTNALNKPKKSVYFKLMVRYYNEDNHIKSLTFDFNGDKEINEGCKFVSENFDLFSVDELRYINGVVFSALILTWKASVVYAGLSNEKAESIYKPLCDKVKDNKELTNIFSEIKINRN